MNLFLQNEQNLLVEGEAGNIDVRTQAPQVDDKKIIGIICHPHPLYGGTMDNKVVSTLNRTLLELGVNTVRFNFRGVGKTEGVFDNGDGETQDVITLVNWIKSFYPSHIIWLAGFSFGGFVSARAAIEIQPAQLISIAPMVSRFVEVNLPAITIPWVLVLPEKDEVIDVNATLTWLDTLDPKPKVIFMPDAGHFFHGRLVELRERLKEALV